ncbi:serine hydrolase domain-containing protein [Enterococcus rivorum]|uniref:Beta-lactamase-related domain-containing protein n=1 Tax=Enterococcus rivorum TaxID=762845 RepID=A0A1E5KZ61_9ENTE|nr:serine hydrolase domain-containing protein [Enterococcus rivorum]MBP2099462.1 CubicO group peptidase (beta-lactamase class C family) [Enterococcus rivorum]OEH83157.1 hypothetical protein BCR26_10795 [Enterococcus rivorum]
MSKYSSQPKHKGKSQTKPYTFFYLLCIVLLVGVLLLEMYTLFIQVKRPSSATHQTTSATGSLTNNKKKEEAKKENFDQPVEPTTNSAKTFDESIRKNNFIGTALIIQNGQIILQKGYGYANFEQKIANVYNSLFQIGSIQKAMTAILIMEQVEAGKLSLDDSLSTFYPTIPTSQQISIRQLLSMTSGLHSTEHPNQLMTDDELIHFAVNHIKSENYGTFQYDAINYTLLVGILTKLTDKDYYHLFSQNILSKLNLNQTFFYQDFIIQPNATSAYKKIGSQDYAQLVKETPVESTRELGTGNVATSNADLYRFFSSFAQGKIISPDFMGLLWISSETGNYAGGLYNYTNYYYGHGVESGFETVLCLSKDGQNAVILSTNEHPDNSSNQELGKSLFNQLYSAQ